MGMMQKMRSLTPIFIIGVGGLFVLFMILSDSKVLEVLGQDKNVVGYVNGEKITYEEYNRAVDNYREQYKAQTGVDIEEDQMDYLRDQIWDQLITQKLVEQQMKKMNIEVSDKEVDDYIFGPNPPEFLKQQFIDSTGRFRRDIYMQALKDPRNKQILENLKKGLKEELKQQKLGNILFASVSLSEGEILQKYKDQNVFANVEFLAINPESVSDNEVKVTDEDLKKYYDEHQNDFKFDAQRKIKFVQFVKQPSGDDSTSAFNLLSETKKLITSDTASLKSYENPFVYKKDTVGMDKLSPEAFAALNSTTVKNIVGPFKSNGGYALYKLLGKTQGKNTYVNASHILVDDENLANEIYNRLTKGENFANLAKQYSKDPGSASNGGNLGWFGKGRMVKEFEDACFNGPVGKVQKPVKTSYGYHIILVNNKSNAAFVVEELESVVRLSGATKDILYQKASDFQYFADKNSFDEAVKHFNVKQYVMETPLFTKNQGYVPGIANNQSIINWSFENDKGDISYVFSTPQAYLVCQITDAKEAGVKPFDEVKNFVKAVVTRKKKIEYAASLLEKIKKSINPADSLSVYAKLNSNLRFGKTGRFSAQTLPTGIGADWKVINEIMNAKAGSFIGPIKGKFGAYLVKVYENTGLDKKAYKMQREQFINQLLNEKKQSFIQAWLMELREKAKIKDERYKFYR
ncbi:MAG TPA: peptidylprolyl isomerase [Ignavibacteriales bacterium]|nr:peptidylprolyl isomerase [Ignavibacteriales bacterium]